MIPQLKRLLQSDIPDAPEWMGTVLGTINKFMQDTYNVLKKQVTFQDNIRCEIKEISIVAPVSELRIPIGIQNPIGVLLLGIDSNNAFTSEPVLRWKVAQSAVNIVSISGLTSGKQYLLRILVI